MKLEKTSDPGEDSKDESNNSKENDSTFKTNVELVKINEDKHINTMHESEDEKLSNLYDIY